MTMNKNNMILGGKEDIKLRNVKELYDLSGQVAIVTGGAAEVPPELHKLRILLGFQAP